MSLSLRDVRHECVCLIERKMASAANVRRKQAAHPSSPITDEHVYFYPTSKWNKQHRWGTMVTLALYSASGYRDKARITAVFRAHKEVSAYRSIDRVHDASGLFNASTRMAYSSNIQLFSKDTLPCKHCNEIVYFHLQALIRLHRIAQNMHSTCIANTN